MLIRYLVNICKIGIFYTLSTLTVNAFDWQLDALADMAMPECTLNNIAVDLDAKAAGICAKVYKFDNYLDTGTVRLLAAAAKSGIKRDPTDIYAELFSQYGGTFNVGNLLTCNIGGQESVALASLGDLCRVATSKEVVLSSLLTLSSLTADAGGIFTGGLMGDQGISADDYKFPSGLLGKRIYREATITDEFGNSKVVAGGMAIAEIERDSHSPVAKAIISDDIATLVLTDMALKNLGITNPSKILLPATKADSKDDVNHASQALISLHPDLNQLIDLMAADLSKAYEANISVGGPDCDTMIDMKEYRRLENAESTAFFIRAEYILNAYENIELEAKGIMASKLLLQTAEKGHIFDPSEARARYISDEYKIPFRYAAFIQQEKTKVMQYKVTTNAVRMKQLIDLAKKQAQIKARVFRSDIAKCEIERLLDAVDQSITY